MIFEGKPACDECVRLFDEHEIDGEMVQPVQAGAMASLSRRPSVGRICADCASAEALSGSGGMTFSMARVAVGTCRRESYRLPGAPIGLIVSGYMKASEPGDLERALEWLDWSIPHWMEA